MTTLSDRAEKAAAAEDLRDAGYATVRYRSTRQSADHGEDRYDTVTGPITDLRQTTVGYVVEIRDDENDRVVSAAAGGNTHSVTDQKTTELGPTDAVEVAEPPEDQSNPGGDAGEDPDQIGDDADESGTRKKPPEVPEKICDEWRELLREGKSTGQIADRTDWSKTCVRRHVHGRCDHGRDKYQYYNRDDESECPLCGESIYQLPSHLPDCPER
jgi:hypothetical protein